MMGKMGLCAFVIYDRKVTRHDIIINDALVMTGITKCHKWYIDILWWGHHKRSFASAALMVGHKKGFYDGILNYKR